MNKLLGSVWLDGAVSYAGITPRFTAHGLDVYRLREKDNVSLIETVGPHIFLQWPALLLTSIPVGALAKGAKYSFTGPGIGSIQMLYGYPAADLGSESRYVEQYSAFVSIDADSLNFCIDGWAGPVIEGTKHTGKVYSLRQDFRIEFAMPEKSFNTVIDHKHAPDTLRALLKKAASNAQSGNREYLAPSPHTTRHAGPHRAVHQL